MSSRPNLNGLPGGIEVASVNMSLGGGSFAGTCDNDPRKMAIDNLRAAGVLTAIASGNDEFRTAINAPACISTAVAVGSTTKTDVVSSFSNISNVVDLLAPGGFGGGTCSLGANNNDILSSVPGTARQTSIYECQAGTSMAAPHVAGAIAAMRSACPTASADAIEAALKTTGTPITDTRAGAPGNITKPRIRVDLAVQNLNCGVPPPPVAQSCTLASELGDFNGDGRDDLLFRRGDGLISQYLMNGFQVISAQVLGAFKSEFTLQAAADFNGDGKADMLFRRSDGLMWLSLLDGPQVIASQPIGSVGLEWAIVGAADFNGDGRADILFRRDSDGMLALFLMNGFEILDARLLGAVGPEWRVRGVRDFNGDGRADILFRRSGDGTMSLFLFNGFQNLGAALIGQVGVEWNLLGVRDFNGDGRADILFRRNDGMLSLFLMNGFQILDARLLGVVGPEFTLLGLGDINGDGRSDMVFRRNTDGVFSVFLMNGFEVLDARFLGSVGTEWSACYGQPPLAVAQASEK